MKPSHRPTGIVRPKGNLSARTQGSVGYGGLQNSEETGVETRPRDSVVRFVKVGGKAVIYEYDVAGTRRRILTFDQKGRNYYAAGDQLPSTKHSLKVLQTLFPDSQAPSSEKPSVWTLVEAILLGLDPPSEHQLIYHIRDIRPDSSSTWKGELDVDVFMNGAGEGEEPELLLLAMQTWSWRRFSEFLNWAPFGRSMEALGRLTSAYLEVIGVVVSSMSGSVTGKIGKELGEKVVIHVLENTLAKRFLKIAGKLAAEMAKAWPKAVLACVSAFTKSFAKKHLGVTLRDLRQAKPETVHLAEPIADGAAAFATTLLVEYSFKRWAKAAGKALASKERVQQVLAKEVKAGLLKSPEIFVGAIATAAAKTMEENQKAKKPLGDKSGYDSHLQKELEKNLMDFLRSRGEEFIKATLEGL